MMKGNLILISIFMLIFPTGVFAIDGLEIAIKIDERQKPVDMKSEMKMVLINKKGKTRTNEIRSITKDDNEKQIIWFLSPKDDKGVAFLKIEHNDADDEMRLWLPAFKKVRRISAGKTSDSFMGSDLSYEDLTTRDLDDYEYKLLGEEMVFSDSTNNNSATQEDSTICYVLEVTPKQGVDTEYSKHIDWVTKDNFLVLRSESYDNKNKILKIRTIGYKKMKNYFIPIEILVKNVQKNHKTNLIFDKIEVDTNVADDLFQEKNLKRLPQ